jgi:hypothetical protein
MRSLGDGERGLLAKLKAATTNAPLPLPPALQRVTFPSTTQIPTNLGTGNNESVVIAGDFRVCRIGVRMEALVEVLLAEYSWNYQFGFQVSLRSDVQLAHRTAFCALTGITAT